MRPHWPSLSIEPLLVRPGNSWHGRGSGFFEVMINPSKKSRTMVARSRLHPSTPRKANRRRRLGRTLLATGTVIGLAVDLVRLSVAESGLSCGERSRYAAVVLSQNERQSSFVFFVKNHTVPRLASGSCGQRSFPGTTSNGVLVSSATCWLNLATKMSPTSRSF